MESASYCFATNGYTITGQPRTQPFYGAIPRQNTAMPLQHVSGNQRCVYDLKPMRSSVHGVGNVCAQKYW